MSVLITGFSVIVRNNIIGEKYPGGLDAYIKDCPNALFCKDQNLTRICFMDEGDAREFIDSLAAKGFVPWEDGKCLDVALVCGGKGPLVPCDWLQFARWQNRLIAFESGTDPSLIAMLPQETESTVSYIDTEQLYSTYDLVEVKNNVETWKHKITGRKIYIGRTSKKHEEDIRPKLSPSVEKLTINTTGKSIKWGAFKMEGQIIVLDTPQEERKLKKTRWSFLKTIFSKKKSPMDRICENQVFHRLKWLQPGENPWKIRALDCRPLIEAAALYSDNPNVANHFSVSRTSSGFDVPGRLPETLAEINLELSYPIPMPESEGVIFRAKEMEDKWDVFHFDGKLYFCSSWTGEIIFMALINRDRKDQLKIKRILYDYSIIWGNTIFGGGEGILQKYSEPKININSVVSCVDFLISRLVCGLRIPVPIPPEFKERKPEFIALFAYALFGRNANYITFETPPKVSLEEYKRQNTRKASALILGGSKPIGNPLATHFGLAPVALKGESWPLKDGKPLFFICQLNLTECPYVPDILHDIKLLTLFIAAVEGKHGILNKGDWILWRDNGYYFSGCGESKENGSTWLLRTYKSLDDLVPLQIPDGCSFKKGFEGKWELVDDFPTHHDPGIIIPQGFDKSDVYLDNVSRTKIGGFSGNIQNEPWWDYRPHPDHPAFCFQINEEGKVNLRWGDRGQLYFARGTAEASQDRWYIDFQCY